jgi:phosphatidylinositol alpha-mannosyltransferase
VVQHLGRDAVVIPNGFDFAAFARGPFRSSGGRPRLTSLGRVDEPRKGLDVLLTALPAIRAGLGEVDVVVAGQGSITAPSGVRMIGTITDEAKVELLARSDVFVAPHRARESFGIVLLEAMAAGAPVVASALPAFTDLLQPTGSAEALGELVPVGHGAALARAVVETVRRPRPDRIERAREHARRFDWDRVAPAVSAVYRATVASTAPTARHLGEGSVGNAFGGLVGR